MEMFPANTTEPINTIEVTHPAPVQQQTPLENLVINEDSN